VNERARRNIIFATPATSVRSQKFSLVTALLENANPRNMIDHMTLSSSNYEASKKFYEAALAPLGYKLVKEFGKDVAGFGIGDRLDFWLANDRQKTQPVFHLAFAAETRAQVDEFYRAALASGGRDNGEPGLREKHGPAYYAAFVYDPDGQNIEAVCRK
jgi:catechol 2,3-dioxygenase-like lactoylglutathione lyase family enzyme